MKRKKKHKKKVHPYATFIKRSKKNHSFKIRSKKLKAANAAAIRRSTENAKLHEVLFHFWTQLRKNEPPPDWTYMPDSGFQTWDEFVDSLFRSMETVQGKNLRD